MINKFRIIVFACIVFSSCKSRVTSNAMLGASSTTLPSCSDLTTAAVKTNDVNREVGTSARICFSKAEFESAGLDENRAVDQLVSLIKSIDQKFSPLDSPSHLLIDFWARSNGAIFMKSRGQLIAPYSLAKDQTVKVSIEGIKGAQAVTAHEYAHAIVEANLRKMGGSKYKELLQWKQECVGKGLSCTFADKIRSHPIELVFPAYNEFFADVVAICMVGDLSAIAKAQDVIGSKEQRRDFSKLINITAGHWRPESIHNILDPARGLLGKKIISNGGLDGVCPSLSKSLLAALIAHSMQDDSLFLYKEKKFIELNRSLFTYLEHNLKH